MRADQGVLQRFMVFIQRLWGSGDSSGRLVPDPANRTPFRAVLHGRFTYLYGADGRQSLTPAPIAVVRQKCASQNRVRLSTIQKHS